MNKFILIIITLSSFSIAEMMEENFGENPSSTTKIMETNNLDSNIEEGYIEVNLDDIDRDRNISSIVDSNDSMGNDKVLSKITLKKYPKVKYKKSMYKYAINNPGKTKKSSQLKFKKYLEDSEIDEFIFSKLLDSDDSIKSLKMSALYYDWYLLNPSIAENFYKLLYKKKKELKLYEKYLLADYLIRTNRGDMINKFIEKRECSVIFKGRSNCFYYLGLDDYLNTGNRANNYLRLSKGKNKMAKYIYKYK